jgi:hypothetical protein
VTIEQTKEILFRWGFEVQEDAESGR